MNKVLAMLRTVMLFLMGKCKREYVKFKAWYIKMWMPVIYRFVCMPGPGVYCFTNNKYKMVGKGKGGGGGDAKSNIINWIGLVISLIFGIYLLPLVVDTIASTNYTNWNFTGAAGAKVLYGLLPFIFIIGMIVYFIGRLLGKI